MLLLKPLGVELNFIYDFIHSIIEHKVEIVINYPNVIHNISLVNIDDIQIITEILSLTDIYLFEKKEALAFFTLQSHLLEGSNGQSTTSNKTEEKSLEILFLKEIKKKRKLFPKIGVFIEEFHHVTVIEQEIDTNLVLYHSDYDFELYKNHNIELDEKLATKEEIHESDEYKKIILNNYSLLKACFFGGFFSRFIHKKSFNTACHAGNQLIKKVMDLIRYKLPFNDPKQFLVRIKKPKKVENVNVFEEENKGREGRFVLDCCNLISSKMNRYNPLYDDNLTTHFSSFSTRKHLKKVGFINKKGNILNDPDKNNIGVPKNRHLLKVFENEKKKLNNIKDNNDKMKLQINNLFQRKEKSLKNVSTADLHKFTRVNFNPITNKKLPTLENIWDKHPLQKKAGSTLYAANITTAKKNLKPISKDIYVKLLNNFENKATNEMLGKEDLFKDDTENNNKISKTQNQDFYKKKDSKPITQNNNNNNNYNNNVNKINSNASSKVINNNVNSHGNKSNSKHNTQNNNDNNKSNHEEINEDVPLSSNRKGTNELIPNKVSSKKESSPKKSKEISEENAIGTEKVEEN